jgi:branched-chain amino acid transport system permease protein
MGTLGGVIVGAAVFRLLEFYLDRWFGEYASFLLGLVYIGLVMFIPYGIVGTWQSKQFQIQQGRERLFKLLGLRK